MLVCPWHLQARCYHFLGAVNANMRVLLGPDTSNLDSLYSPSRRNAFGCKSKTMRLRAPFGVIHSGQLSQKP